MNGRAIKQKLIRRFERETGLKHSRDTKAAFLEWVAQQPGLGDVLAAPAPTGRRITATEKYVVVSPARRITVTVKDVTPPSRTFCIREAR